MLEKHSFHLTNHLALKNKHLQHIPLALLSFKIETIFRSRYLKPLCGTNSSERIKEIGQIFYEIIGPL